MCKLRLSSIVVAVLALGAAEDGGASTVRGRLLDRDGTPLRGTVTIRPLLPRDDASRMRAGGMDPAGSIAMIHSGPDGRFEVDVHGGGRFTLEAAAPGHCPVVLATLASGGLDGGAPLTLEPARLVRGGALAGKVAAEDGSPVKDATLVFEPGPSDERPYAPATIRGRSSADGTFLLDGIRDGGGSLTVRAPGFAARRIADVRGTIPVSATLDRGVRLAGRILDADGRACGGAIVEHADTPGGAAARTAPDGTFLLADLPRGEVRILAWAPGHRPASWRGSVPRPDGEAPTLRLPRGPSLRITVWDAHTGEAVPGAVIEPDRETMSTSLTDSSGEACWDVLPPHAVRLTIEARGYLQAEAGPFDLAPGAQASTSVALERAIHVGGRVVDDSGNPLAGVVVVPGRSRPLRDGGHMPFVRAARAGTETGPEGAFHLDDLEAAPTNLELRLEGWARKEVTLGSLAPLEDRRNLVLRMDRGGELGGRVVAGSGKPVPGAVVMAVQTAATPGRNPRAPEPMAETRTGSDGRFLLPAVPPGPAELRVTAAGFAPAAALATAFAGTATETEAVVLRPGRTVKGRTVREDGSPVAGVSVAARAPSGLPRSATTDASGAFELRDLDPDATLAIVAERAGYQRVDAELADAEGAFVITMVEQARLTGRVVDEAGGPVTSFALDVVASFGARTRQEIDDLDGELDVAVDPGTVELEVSAAGYLPARVAAVAVPRPPAVAPPIVVALDRGGAVEGRVVDDDGAPVEGARIVPASPDLVLRGRRLPQEPAAGFTLADGTFRVTGLPPGARKLRVEAPAHAPADVEVAMAPGSTARVDVLLSRGVTLPGFVLLPGGRPAASARVTVYRGTQVDRRMATDADGAFIFAGLPLGTFELEAETVSGATSPRVPVVLDRLDPPPVSLSIAAGSRIEGTISGVPRDRLPDVSILALSPQGSFTATPAADGTFVLADVPPGELIVTATAPGDHGPVAVTRALRITWSEPVVRLDLDLSGSSSP